MQSLTVTPAGPTDGVTVRLDQTNHLSDEVTVIRHEDGTVSLTVLVGVNPDFPDDPPEECFASLRLPAAAWDALRTVGSGE